MIGINLQTARSEPTCVRVCETNTSHGSHHYSHSHSFSSNLFPVDLNLVSFWRTPKILSCWCQPNPILETEGMAKVISQKHF